MTRYYDARCGSMWLDDGGGWLPVRLPVGLPGHLANPPECTRPAEALAAIGDAGRQSRDRGSATAGGHPRWRWFRAQRPGLTYFRPAGIWCAACSPAARRLWPRRPGRARLSGHRAREDRWMARIGKGVLTVICQLCRTSRRRKLATTMRSSAAGRGCTPIGTSVPFVAGLARFLALPAPPCAGGPTIEAWPITQSAGVPRSRSSRCAKCGRTVMVPSRSRGTGGRVALPGPGAGSWSTRRPGTSRAWFRRENSPAGSGRWTCSPMCPGFPPTWGRLPRLTVPRWWTWSWIATPSCWLTGPGGRHGPTRSWCPAAIATDGPRPRLRNWRLVRRR